MKRQISLQKKKGTHKDFSKYSYEHATTTKFEKPAVRLSRQLVSGGRLFNDCTHTHWMIAVILDRKKHPPDMKKFHRAGSVMPGQSVARTASYGFIT